MKSFEFPGYPDAVVDQLIERGYLEKSQENDLEAQKAAMTRWREDKDATRPICPSVEDLSREAECRTCRDACWVYASLDPGKPDFGKVILCPDCSEWREAEERDKRMLAMSGIPNVHRRDDFSSFVLVPGTEEALDAAVKLAEGTAKFSLLMIYGGVGNGKSHLAYAACLHAKGYGLRVKYQSLPEFFADLRKEMAKREGDSEAIMTELKETPFLALDDPSTIFNTDWQESRLIELIDYRYARQFPTILTTNRDLKSKTDGTGKKIEALPEQILRRFRESGVGLTVLNAAPEYKRRRRDESTKGR